MKKCTIFATTLLVCFLLGLQLVNAKSNDWGNGDSNRHNSPSSTEFSAILENSHYDVDENILVSFLFENYYGYTIIDYEYTNIGFNVISLIEDSDNSNVINAVLAFNSNLNEAVFNLTIEYESGSRNACVYAIKNEHGVFVSNISFENAEDSYLYYCLRTGVITREEYHSIIKEKTSHYLITDPTELQRINSYVAMQLQNDEVEDTVSQTYNLTNSEQIHVNGLIMWTDDNNYSHYLRWCKAEVYISGDTPGVDEPIATGNVRSDGILSIYIDTDLIDIPISELELDLIIYAGIDDTFVYNINSSDAQDETELEVYYTTVPTIQGEYDPLNYYCSMSISMDSVEGQAMQILLLRKQLRKAT